jgi:ABC-type branched-subunit amino acid transport system permease subunit
MAHLGALAGLITMVHQIFGGIGAYGGALIFDATGTYDAAFILVLAASVLALVLTLMMRTLTPLRSCDEAHSLNLTGQCNSTTRP